MLLYKFDQSLGHSQLPRIASQCDGAYLAVRVCHCVGWVLPRGYDSSEPYIMRDMGADDTRFRFVFLYSFDNGVIEPFVGLLVASNELNLGAFMAVWCVQNVLERQG